jgi:hypothetical protein
LDRPSSDTPANVLRKVIDGGKHQIEGAQALRHTPERIPEILREAPDFRAA